MYKVLDFYQKQNTDNQLKKKLIGMLLTKNSIKFEEKKMHKKIKK